MTNEQAPHGFPVVGIGASAGGLPALEAFFEAVAPDSGMAYVVIVHLSKNHDSVLDEILQGCSKIPVRQVTEKIRVVPNHVYVIPPTHNLTMVDGEIALTDRHDESGKRMPIDLFFRTLGEFYGRDAFAVLSGSGSDGTMGIECIKEVGGVTLAQDPAEAECGDMPASAIATQMIDVILPAGQLAQKNRGHAPERSRGGKADSAIAGRDCRDVDCPHGLGPGKRPAQGNGSGLRFPRDQACRSRKDAGTARRLIPNLVKTGLFGRGG